MTGTLYNQSDNTYLKGETYSKGEVDALQSAQDASLLAQLPPTSFVSNSAMTVADLLANFPANSSRLGKYARVTDLWGNTDEIMRCSSDGSTYFWRPQRTDYAQNMSTTSGTTTLTPLVTPPTVVMTGTLLGNVTVTPSSTNAWPGATFTVISNGVLGLFGINITGLIGGTLPILAGGVRTITFTTAGWRGA